MGSPTDTFFAEYGIRQVEIAQLLGVNRSAVSRKVAGDRPWKQSEIETLLAYTTNRLGRKVRYEELFGAPADESCAEPTAALPEEFPVVGKS